MPEKVSWTMRLQIEGGPSFQLGQTLEPEAYEKFSVTVPKEGKPVDIPLPGDATLLLAQCSKRTAPQEGQKIECKLGDSELCDLADVPLIVIGNGLIKTLSTEGGALEFSNNKSDLDVVIDILICRDLPENQG